MNSFDIDMLLALNFDGGKILDAIMWAASGTASWIPLYLLVLFLLYRRFGWKYMLAALVLFAVAVGICDQVCNLFKDNFAYLRPTHTPLLAQLHTVNGYLGGLRGTVSAHAANTFCIFLLSSLMMKRRWFTLMMLAYTLLASYSRIYLGVHFPLQVFFGLALGALVALGLWYLFTKIENGKWKIDKLHC